MSFGGDTFGKKGSCVVSRLTLCILIIFNTIPCSKLCGKAFSRDKTLRQHLLYHDNKRDVECEICGFRAINMPKLKRHLKSHSKQRDYSCSICNKRFLYSYNVTAHIKFVHWKQKRNSTDDSKLKCYVCGKKYQKIWKVKEHMREEHKIIEEITLINE